MSRINSKKDLQWKYFQAMQLLDDIGPWALRLQAVQQMVSEKDFVYDQQKNSTPFLYTFLHSSYWLDKELFDTKVIRYPRLKRNLTGEQQAHLLLLDIGCMLIEKGFPLEEFIRKHSQSSNPTQNWASAFWKQCQERKTFLEKRLCVHHSRSFKADTIPFQGRPR